MMDDMKKNELNEQELNQVTGGGVIQDVKDLLEIADKVAEMASGLFGGSEGTNENQNSDITSSGSGASGGWNEITSHGGGASGGW